MKKIIYSLFLTSVFCSGLFFSCNDKKKDDPAPKKAKQNDQSGSTEADDAIKDVNDFVNNRIGGGSNMRTAGYNLPCGVISVDSSTTANGYKVYKMKYGNQNTCGYKKKSGDVSFKLLNGAKFSDQGAVHSITFTDYVVEAVATGEIVKLNGTMYITNVSGGYVWQAVTQNDTIVHKVRGTFYITYDNNEVRERKYFQERTWSSTNSWAGLSFEADGDTLIGAAVVSEVGKTYEGNYDFYTEIITPLKWSNCGSTFAGPYVLKTGHAKAVATIPGVSPAYFEVEAGYYYNVSTPTATPTKVNDCNSNSYKITAVIGTLSNTEYQLY